MKYIVTQNTITAFVQGATMTLDASHDKFDDIKAAIEDGADELEIVYILHKELIDKAKDLLLHTGGDLTAEEKGQ